MKSIKISKLKGLVPKKVLRGILWTLLVLITVKGIVGIIRPDNSKKTYDKISENIDTAKLEMNNEKRANSFAENFAREFFSYKNGQTEEYRKRLSLYMTQQAISSIPTSLAVDSTVLDSTAINSKILGDGKYNVDVKVKIQGSNVKDVYVRIPVSFDKDGSNMAAEDIPLFIAKPKLADIETIAVDGTAVDSGVKSEIETMINNFLKVYAEGTEEQINYYLSDASNKLAGLDSIFKFRNVIEVKAFTTEKEDEFNCYASYVLQDQDTKQDLKQKMSLKVVKKDKRYYIEFIDVRNLK